MQNDQSRHSRNLQHSALWALSSHSPQSDLMSALIQYLKRRHGAKGRGIGLGSMNLFLELFQLSVPSRYFKTSPEIIQLAVMLYVRFPLSLRNVEDLLHERGVDVSYESVRY